MTRDSSTRGHRLARSAQTDVTWNRVWPACCCSRGHSCMRASSSSPRTWITVRHASALGCCTEGHRWHQPSTCLCSPSTSTAPADRPASKETMAYQAHSSILLTLYRGPSDLCVGKGRGAGGVWGRRWWGPGWQGEWEHSWVEEGGGVGGKV